MPERTPSRRAARAQINTVRKQPVQECSQLAVREPIVVRNVHDQLISDDDDDGIVNAVDQEGASRMDAAD
jgi:hypothetical protein